MTDRRTDGIAMAYTRHSIYAVARKKVANFNLPHLHFAPQLGVTPFEFRRTLWRQKTRVPELSSGVACVILCLAVLIQYRRVSDRRQTHGRICSMFIHSSRIGKRIVACNYRAMHYSAKHGLAIASRLPVCSSVCLCVKLVDDNQIGWKSWKLTARTISPTFSLFVAQRSSTYPRGHMEKFWGENVRSAPTSITSS